MNLKITCLFRVARFFVAALILVPILCISNTAFAARKPKVIAEEPALILNRQAVNAAVEDQLSSLHRCYLVAARKHSGVKVKLSVAFEIAPDGHVPSAKVVKNSIQDGLFESCIVDSVRSWGFAAPAEGSAVKVTYPLVFSAEDGGTVKAERKL